MHGLAYCTGWLVLAVFKILISHLGNEWETKQSVALFGRQTTQHSHQEISINFFQLAAHFISKARPDRLRKSKSVESGLVSASLYYILLGF